MIIDNSAVLAILFAEDDAAAYAQAIERAGGSGHPAGLNFGDCFSYALAKLRDEPLLFKGGDFTETDVRSALTGAAAG